MLKGSALPPVTFFPDGWRDVPWPEPEVSVEATSLGPSPVSGDSRRVHRTRLVVRSDAYARLVHLRVPEQAGDAMLTDDYFDVPAGAEYVLEARSERPLSAAAIRIGSWTGEWL